MALHLAMPEKVPREASAHTFAIIEKLFEHIYRSLREVSQQIGAGTDLTAIEEAIAQLQADVAALQTTPVPHDLLSVTHEDTEANPPARGSIIVGVAEGGGDEDSELYWADGGVNGFLLGDQEPGGGAFFEDGGVYGGLGQSATLVWKRITPTAPGQVPTFNGLSTEWT